MKNPFAATDLVILKSDANRLMVFVVEITKGEFVGQWALPGAAVREDETLEQAATRAYTEATGEKKAYFEQLATFSELDRDPRHRAISTAYIAIPQAISPVMAPGEKYAKGAWVEVKKAGKLAFDHSDILKTAIARITSKLQYSTMALHLLPEEFTLTELQNLYEYLSGQEIDKRNFRKKIESLDIVAESGNMKRGEKARPAKLYRARNTTIDIIPLFKN